MKKLFILFVIICGITLSCTDSSFDNIPENISFKLDRENVTITSDGGSVEVLVYSNYKWKISGACDWCSPSLANGEANEDGTEVVFHVKENGTFDSREAVFCFQCGDKSIEFIIYQASRDGLTSSHSTNLDVSGLGETIAIQYIATQDCDVIIPDDAMSWISIDPATRGLEEHSTMLNIMANNTGETRKATIKVVFRDNAEIFVEYTITQISKNYYIQYTSADGEKIYAWQLGDSQEVNNTYENGVGVIEFNNPVTEIDDDAFKYCNNLTSISLPNSVTYIGSVAFLGCTNLSNITFEEGVKTIGDHAFSGCSSLTSITIPDSVTSIGDYAFSRCTSLTSVIIPDSVTEIGDYAFRGCTSLTSITIPDSVTSIGINAFDGCTGELIVNCNIPNASSYDHGAFCGSKFTQVTIGDSVTSIGSNAFKDCDSLTSITIPNSVTSIGYRAFYGCNSLTSVTIGDGVTEIGDSAFGGCTSPTSVTIGNGVTSIGDYAFFECNSLTSVTIPDSVTSIGDSAFRECTSLTSITIPNSVTSIGDSVFEYCDSLTSVTIPDSVTEIGNFAFYNCDSLTSVTIGNGVTEIGNVAFGFCDSLKEVYCKPTTPPRGGLAMFDNNASGRKIYVPTESVEAYKSASYWWDYSGKIFGYNF